MNFLETPSLAEPYNENQIGDPFPVETTMAISHAQGWNARREFTSRAFEEFDHGEIDIAELRRLVCEAN